MSIWSSERTNLQDTKEGDFLDVASSGLSDRVRVLAGYTYDSPNWFEVELSAGDAVRLARALLRASERAYDGWEA